MESQKKWNLDFLRVANLGLKNFGFLEFENCKFKIKEINPKKKILNNKII